MPCVFPILALKALHLSRAGGGDGARRGAMRLAYAAGAIVGTGALGAVLLAIRAGGSAGRLGVPAAGPAHDHAPAAAGGRDHREPARPVRTAGARRTTHSPAGSFGTGALAAFVATPCAGPVPRRGARHRAAAAAGGSVLVFAALGLGLALPFLLVAFIPALRTRLPKPRPWMDRLQRFLAIPMAATRRGVPVAAVAAGGRERRC